MIEDKIFENLDFSMKALPQEEYELCRFVNCNFSENNLSMFRFVECDFKDCNLSLVKIGATVLNTVSFSGCKMMGIHFDHSADILFSVSFDNCILNFSSFYKRNLKKTRFDKCSLKEVDFTEADLSSAVLDQCDLTGAKFEQTILEKADLSTSLNFTIDPRINKLKKAKFSLEGLPGLLTAYDIVIA